MEKDFTPYEEALELKELGFDEPCFGWYHYKLIVGKEFSILEFEKCKNGESWITGKHCSAPTFSQAFRWFREKYELYSHVRESYAFDKTLEFVTQINGSYVNHRIKDKPINRFETYEEAELECLKKLIEIVKNAK